MNDNYPVNDIFTINSDVHIGFYMELSELNLHSHECWELSYVYEGQGLYCFKNNMPNPIKEGEFILVSPGVKHCVASLPNSKGSKIRILSLLVSCQYMNILINKLCLNREFDDYSLRNILTDTTPLNVHLKDFSDSIYRMLMVTANEYYHFSDGSSTIIENTILNAFIFTIRLYEDSINKTIVSTAKDENINNIINYIKTNYSSHITLSTLAEYAHLSPEYLSRYFKKQTGKNIFEFITEIRMDRAKYLLRVSEFSVNKISILCGYNSYSNFQKSFKKYVGVSAGQYRDLKNK